MLQNIIRTYKSYDEINGAVARLESCKYITVKDIRILPAENTSSFRAQILYDYYMKAYNNANNKQ